MGKTKAKQSSLAFLACTVIGSAACTAFSPITSYP
jgi:hypothetical protein